MPGNYWLQRICAKDYSDDFRIYIFSRRALCIMFQWQVVTMHLRFGSLWSTWPWQHRSYVTGSLKAPTTICHTQIKGHLHSLVFLKKEKYFEKSWRAIRNQIKGHLHSLVFLLQLNRMFVRGNDFKRKRSILKKNWSAKWTQSNKAHQGMSLSTNSAVFLTSFIAPLTPPPSFWTFGSFFWRTWRHFALL